MMVLAMRIVVGLVALFFLVFGLRALLTPDAMAAEFFISPLGAAGLATVRGDIGGMFLACAMFTALGLRPGHAHWLKAPALVMGAIAACRVVGFAIDGLVPSSVTAFVAEIVLVALLLIPARRLTAAAVAS